MKIIFPILLALIIPTNLYCDLGDKCSNSSDCNLKRSNPTQEESCELESIASTQRTCQLREKF